MHWLAYIEIFELIGFAAIEAYMVCLAWPSKLIGRLTVSAIGIFYTVLIIAPFSIGNL
jgi:hypothetical protein